MNKAKLFICHHPATVMLYSNLAKIIRKYDKDAKIILFKVSHNYFSEFDFNPYEKYYDEIVDFDFIGYKRNFLVGFWEIFKFQKKLKRIISGLLTNFETIDLFLADSAWLPINILLYNLSEQENVKNITKISFAESWKSQTKTDNIKSFLCFLYSLFFRCYKIKVITTLGGKFLNFNYVNNTPGTIIKVVSPTGQLIERADMEKENLFPYPVIFKSSPVRKKDIIIIFGDADIFQFYSEYLPDYQTFVKKITNFFNAIEKKYFDCKLYYKPHPSDGNKIMPGIDIKKYTLFDNTVDAQFLLDKFNQGIKAVYSFSSSSIIFGSFFGIPSYFFYRYLFNQAGIERLDSFFNQDNIKSKFIFYISDLKEIGAIDDMGRPKPSDLVNFDSIYHKVLNI